MADPQRFAEALKQNAAAFEQHLPQLLESEPERCALFREGSLVKTFDNMADAAAFAVKQYPDGLYMLRIVRRMH